MMNFRKRVKSLEREPPVFMACHGNSVNNTKANIDKKLFERPSDAYVSTVKISFQLKLPFRS